ncbi:MAG: PadR family transcriptional regulator [Candidatus Calditenuis sp.]|nr:PadR family transcriptional regulator [Candidatus Calditenuis sp.]
MKESRALRRTRRKLTVENLWLYVIAVLLEGPRYGYELVEEIGKRFGFRPSRITCYVVLYRLEGEGLIRSSGVRRSESGGPRVYYEVTEKGREQFEAALGFIEDVLQALRSSAKGTSSV